MRLVLLDTDHYFVEMCASYIRTSEHAELFTLTVFTNKEQGFVWMEQTKEPSIWLVHESFLPLPDKVYHSQNGCLLLLSDRSANRDIKEYPILYKYQPLNQFIAHVIAHFNEYASSSKIKGNRATNVISVYSAVGGSGKTLTATHLARELILQGERVFYLNLEQLPSAPWLKADTKHEEHFYSKILYYGKSDPNLQAAKVELYKRRHSLMGFDFFPGVCEPLEMEEMTAADTQCLIQSILTSGMYDSLVLDLASSLHPRVLKALTLSDHILWLVNDDCVQWDKMNVLLKQLKQQISTGKGGLSPNLHVVVNKYTGKLLNDPAALSTAISGYLPYVPEWKALGAIETLVLRGAFSESVRKLNVLKTMKAEATLDAAG